MKQRKIHFCITIVTIVISCIITIVFGKLLITSGNLRDAYELTGADPFYAGIGLWIGFFLSATICLTAFFVCVCRKDSRSFSFFSIGTICILLIFSAIIIPSFQQYKEEIKQQKSSSGLTPLTLEELRQKLEFGDSIVVYIGRDSCGECLTVRHSLEKLQTESHGVLYYYNTEYDRIQNPEKMTELLQRLNVEAVPSVVKIDKGTVLLFDDEALLHNVASYLSDTTSP